MPMGDVSRRLARYRPPLFLLPFRPFLFVARRTLLLCAAALICYVMVSSMIGYDGLWVGPSTAAPDHPSTGHHRVTKIDAPIPQRGDTDTNQTTHRRTDAQRNVAGENGSSELGKTRAVSSNVQIERKERTGPDVAGILLNRTGMDDFETQSQLIADDPNSLTKLPLCPMPPPDLIGKMKQAVLLMGMLKESDVIRSHPELLPGGHWKPKSCRARYKVAVIVPFRDRQSHLNRLIDFLVPMLERQLIDFRFIVTEQYGKDLFNKGRIMNAAFLFAKKLGVDCVVFHDVDMFPQDDRNFYYCPDEPMHMGAFVNTLGYELWYDYIVGGVLAINMDHYQQVNGYSNMYWAWGGEDDDMGFRILANNLTILRPDKVHGTYTMLKHVKRQRTAPSMIYKLLNTAKTRWKTDGLNNGEWKIVKMIVKPLYYHLYVDVGIPPEEWRREKPSKKKK